MEDQTIRATFFARIRSFDIECPRCGQVYCVSRRAGPTNWSTRLSRFQCGRCDLRLALGIIAHPVPWGRCDPPSDIIPTVEQALELRKQMDAAWVGFRLKSGEPVNRLGEPVEDPLWAGKEPISGTEVGRLSRSAVLPPSAARPKKDQSDGESDVE